MFLRHGSGSDKRATSRTGDTAQLKELRTKARRRLIGALALVLAAFITVPWLFDDPPAPEHASAPIVVPAAPDGLPPQLAANTLSPADTSAFSGQVAPGNVDQPIAVDEGAATSTDSPLVSDQAAPPAPQIQQPPAPSDTAPAIVRTPDAAAPKPSPEPAKPKPAPKPTERTDDGSVALALLAGKTPVAKSASPVAQGRYYLQVAAYTTEQDAQARRDSLRQAGVTDAYVERGQSNGRTVYRLRVGSFGSHEAAQAAQTRLRALGYQNGLISDK